MRKFLVYPIEMMEHKAPKPDERIDMVEVILASDLKVNEVDLSILMETRTEIQRVNLTYGKVFNPAVTQNLDAVIERVAEVLGIELCPDCAHPLFVETDLLGLPVLAKEGNPGTRNCRYCHPVGV